MNASQGAEDGNRANLWTITEKSTEPKMVDALVGSYDRRDMFGVIDGDVGLTSLANANDGVQHGSNFEETSSAEKESCWLGCFSSPPY